LTLFEEILSRSEFQNDPPVLVDIGASGRIHNHWKAIAPYSVCVAFDADDREFGFVTKDSSGFKKLHVFNCIVTDKDAVSTDFYLTASPFCSSILEPDTEGLKPYAFGEKFSVDRKINLNAVTLIKALEQSGATRVDWFKSDSQGTDLRLFQNLPVSMQDEVIVAEFEPGIIDAYHGEDKLYELLAFMGAKPFWMSSMTVKGSQRFSSSLLKQLSDSSWIQKMLAFAHEDAPGWAETVYMNSFTGALPVRGCLLGWVFATIQHQHAFALQCALDGAKKFNDPIFTRMADASRGSIWRNLFGMKIVSAARLKLLKVFDKH
jgi:hypothetical protein